MWKIMQPLQTFIKNIWIFVTKNLIICSSVNISTLTRMRVSSLGMERTLFCTSCSVTWKTILKTLKHSFEKAFPPSFPFSIIFSTSLPHLNKLTIFFLLEKRIEPVHRHPVMLLDLGEADPEDYMLMIMDDQLQLLMWSSGGKISSGPSCIERK